MIHERAIDLIPFMPFFLTTLYGFRRYQRRGGVNRIAVFGARAFVWHLGFTVIGLLGYPLALALVLDKAEGAAFVARGCGQGLLQAETVLLSSCQSYALHAGSIWVSLTCLMFGVGGLTLVIVKMNKQKNRQ